MKKLLPLLLVSSCLCFAIQYSLRMMALGTDFAYLIPDYETDLYNNPNLMGENLNGISYEPGLSTPLTLRMLTKRFGWFGNYWASYSNNKLPQRFHNVTSISVNDLWMLDLRGKFWKFLTEDVWNLCNDFIYDETRYYDDEANRDTTRIIEYLVGMSGTLNINKYFKLIQRIGAGYYGYYRNYRHYAEVQRFDHRQFMYTGRVGLYYRNTFTPNNFTSFYLTIGGPVSNQEIDSLPYSVFSHLSDDEIQQTFFAKTLTVQSGWAKGVTVNDNGFVAIGVCNALLYQRTNRPFTSFAYPNAELRGLRNTLSLPIALEYNIGDVALRIGTRLYYTFKGDKEWNSDSTLVRYNEHNLGFDYSWGIGWWLNEYFTVDLYNTSDLSSKNNWAICLRRTW